MSDALGYAVHWEKPILKQTLGSIKRLWYQMQKNLC
jgi:hypothetical protein